MELKEKELLALYPPYNSVLGPYSRPDGRKHIILNDTSKPKGAKGKLRTISYPKALIESNRYERLKNNETIDHRDLDFTNDTNSNLLIQDRSDHASMDAIRVYVAPGICLQCKKEFELSVSQRNPKPGVAGPFCSRKCSGSYGKSIQLGEEPKQRTKVEKEYYQVSRSK